MQKGKIITRRIDVDATQGLAFFRHKVYAYIKDGTLNFGKAPRKDTVIEVVYDV